MAGFEVGALVGSKGAFVAEPILVEPGAYGVGLLNVGWGLFFGPDGVEGIPRNNSFPLVFAVVSKHL